MMKCLVKVKYDFYRGKAGGRGHKAEGGISIEGDK